MYHDGNTIQEAVDRALNMVSKSYKAYKSIQTEFLDSVPAEYKPALEKLLLSFTECREGLLLWSWAAPSPAKFLLFLLNQIFEI